MVDRQRHGAGARSWSRRVSGTSVPPCRSGHRAATAPRRRADIAAAAPGSPDTGRRRRRSCEICWPPKAQPSASSICCGVTPSAAARSRSMSTCTAGVGRSRSLLTSTKPGILRSASISSPAAVLQLGQVQALQGVLIAATWRACAADADGGRILQEDVDAGNAATACGAARWMISIGARAALGARLQLNEHDAGVGAGAGRRRRPTTSRRRHWDPALTMSAACCWYGAPSGRRRCRWRPRCWRQIWPVSSLGRKSCGMIANKQTVRRPGCRRRRSKMTRPMAQRPAQGAVIAGLHPRRSCARCQR